MTDGSSDEQNVVCRCLPVEMWWKLITFVDETVRGINQILNCSF